MIFRFSFLYCKRASVHGKMAGWWVACNNALQFKVEIDRIDYRITHIVQILRFHFHQLSAYKKY